MTEGCVDATSDAINDEATGDCDEVASDTRDEEANFAVEVTDNGKLKAFLNTVSSYGVRPVHPGTSMTLYVDFRRMSREGPILLTGTA